MKMYYIIVEFQPVRLGVDTWVQIKGTTPLTLFQGMLHRLRTIKHELKHGDKTYATVLLGRESIHLVLENIAGYTYLGSSALYIQIVE